MKALRIKDVIDKVSLGQSTIYKMVAQGDFPKPFTLAPNRVGWVESEIDEWLTERAAAGRGVLRQKKRPAGTSGGASW